MTRRGPDQWGLHYWVLQTGQHDRLTAADDEIAVVGRRPLTPAQPGATADLHSTFGVRLGTPADAQHIQALWDRLPFEDRLLRAYHPTQTAPELQALAAANQSVVLLTRPQPERTETVLAAIKIDFRNPPIELAWTTDQAVRGLGIIADVSRLTLLWQAEQHRDQAFWSCDFLARNGSMSSLARRLGMTIRRDEDDSTHRTATARLPSRPPPPSDGFDFRAWQSDDERQAAIKHASRQASSAAPLH